MRVAVNLLWLVPGVVGGTEGYATGLLQGLAATGEVDLCLVVLPGFHAAHPELAATVRTVTAPVPAGRHVVRRVAVESTWLGRRLRAWRPDVAHHLGGVLPAGAPGPSVVTLHDLQYQHFPHYFSRAKRAYLGATTRRSLTRADAVTTPSEYTRSDVLRWLGLPGERVRVVPPRLDRLAALPRGEGPALPGKYLLYPAATYPHKNHAVLLDALARASREVPDLHLVLTGAGGAGAWGSAHDTGEALRAQAARLGLFDRVHRLGWLDAAAYRGVLAGATALVFPSRFEGYGLPVAEAMAVGTPVLAADCASVPEVVGADGGVLLPPDDPAAWATAFVRVATDVGHRERLAAAGLRRWTVLAAQDPVAVQLATYRDVAR